MVINSSDVGFEFKRSYKSEKTDTFTETLSRSKDGFTQSSQNKELHERMNLDKQVLVKDSDNNYNNFMESKRSEKVESVNKQTREIHKYPRILGNLREEEHTYTTQEKLYLKTKASIETASGKSINLNFTFNFDSLYSNEKKSSTNIVDPLILNFETPMAILNEKRIKFDINSDGLDDAMINLNSGSGFLALDKDKDGVINNGEELFGTESGNGFIDLKQYDNDNNNWIDENDIVYGSLKILKFNNDGEQELVSLKDSHVGAIYLGSSNGSFTQKNIEGEILGRTTATGFFLKESGDVGTVQQLNLSVRYGWDKDRPPTLDPSLLEAIFSDSMFNPLSNGVESQSTVIEEAEDNKTTENSVLKRSENVKEKKEEDRENREDLKNHLNANPEDLKKVLVELKDNNLATILQMTSINKREENNLKIDKIQEKQKEENEY